MDKLVKLLNEYHFSGTEYIGYFLDEKEDRIYFRTKVVDKGLIDEQRISDERIISKKFGFIKRLVDNDKIDKDKVKDKGGYVKMSRLIWDSSKNDVKKYWEYRLLMLLSIQENPIEFLISILK